MFKNQRGGASVPWPEVAEVTLAQSAGDLMLGPDRKDCQEMVTGTQNWDTPGRGKAVPGTHWVPAPESHLELAPRAL